MWCVCVAGPIAESDSIVPALFSANASHCSVSHSTLARKSTRPSPSLYQETSAADLTLKYLCISDYELALSKLIFEKPDQRLEESVQTSTLHVNRFILCQSLNVNHLQLNLQQLLTVQDHCFPFLVHVHQNQWSYYRMAKFLFTDSF